VPDGRREVCASGIKVPDGRREVFAACTKSTQKPNNNVCNSCKIKKIYFG